MPCCVIVIGPWVNVSSCPLCTKEAAGTTQPQASGNFHRNLLKACTTFGWMHRCWISVSLDSFFMPELNTFNGWGGSLTVSAKSLIRSHIIPHYPPSSTCAMLGAKERIEGINKKTAVCYLNVLVCRRRLVDSGRIRQAKRKVKVSEEAGW